MNQIDMLEIFNNIGGPETFSNITNYFLVFVIAIYTVYAAVIIRQVKLLNKSFHTGISYVLKYFALGLFLASLLLLLFTVITTF